MLGHFNNALPGVGRPVVDLLWLFVGSMAAPAVSTPLFWLVPSWVPMQARLAGRLGSPTAGAGDVR